MIGFTDGTSIDAINANGAEITAGSTYVVKVIEDNPKTDVDESLGCSPEDFGTVDVHTLAVVERGTCARVAKAIFGEQAGAGAVAMLNTSAGLPPYEGQIISNPDDGEPFDVTIPFLGVEGPSFDPKSDAATLVAADGKTVTLTPTTVDNPTALETADFSSGGPRSGDSVLKPDLAAPGVSVTSTGSGTRQWPCHRIRGPRCPLRTWPASRRWSARPIPTWKLTSLWRAAIANTANPALVANYEVSLAGAGLVQVGAATQTRAVAWGPGGAPALNFGFAELGRDYARSVNLLGQESRQHGDHVRGQGHRQEWIAPHRLGREQPDGPGGCDALAPGPALGAGRHGRRLGLLQRSRGADRPHPEVRTEQWHHAPRAVLPRASDAVEHQDHP